jgi:hypothetical protein
MTPEENVNVKDETKLVEDKEEINETEKVEQKQEDNETLKKIPVDLILDYKNSKTTYSMDSINLTYLGWVITITHKLIKDISDDLIARLDQNNEKIVYPETEEEKKNLRRITIKFVFDEDHKRGSYSIDEKLTMVEKRFVLIGIIKLNHDLTDKLFIKLGELVQAQQDELEKYKGPQ